MQEAQDFRAECDDISALISCVGDAIFARVTQFKDWTVSDIIGHLHLLNIVADLSLRDTQEFTDFIAQSMSQIGAGKTHLDVQRDYFAQQKETQNDADIFAAWQNFYPGMADRFSAADPETRVKWVGPDMSARSSIIARQMEHWAHAQAIYDLLGITRVNTDRLKNIAHLGVMTYSWSFRVRSETPPLPKPFVNLTAPSGALWTWNDLQDDNRIDGSAEDFCQIVTQCRNVEDTEIKTTGDTAARWMAQAQCFAGRSETPPPPGTRYKGDGHDLL